MLTDQDKALIQRSWKLIVPIKETAADLFYRRLFELRSDYRALFPEEMGAQKRKLITMLAFVVRALDWPESVWEQTVDENSDLFLVLLALGRRHRELYQIPDESYDTVRDALIWTLDQGLGEAFTQEVKLAWTKVYMVIATTMKMGVGAADIGTPVVPGELGEYVAKAESSLARAGTWPS